MARQKTLLEFPVTFKGVSIGPKNARLGAEFTRDSLALEDADQQLCGRRLTGIITAKPNGSRADQANLPGVDTDTRIDASFDVKGLSVGPDSISIGLTFNRQSIDLTALSNCVQREGVLRLFASEEIPSEDKNGDGEGDEE